MTIERWNTIMESFIKKFGWKKGVNIMVNCKNEWRFKKRINRTIQNLTEGESQELTFLLREEYNKQRKGKNVSKKTENHSTQIS